MSLLETLRAALRQQRSSPVSAAAIVLSIAIAVAVNASVFSIVDALLLSPIPGTSAPERLVRIGGTVGGRGHTNLPVGELAEIRTRVTGLEAVAGHRLNQIVLEVDGVPREVGTELVSANYFAVLGTAMTLGRGFNADEALPAEPTVAVIGHRLWQQQFAGAGDIVGRPAKVSGLPVTIIGVAPVEFSGAFAGFDIQLWLPLGIHDRVLPGRGSIDVPADRIVNLIGRVREDVAPATLQSQLDAVAADWPAAPGQPEHGLEAIAAVGAHPMLAGLATGFLSLLLGITLLLLAIACANVAGLLLARVAARQRELAVRRALGASGADLVRMALTEALVLGGSGGLVGTLGASWLTRVISSLDLPAGIPVNIALAVNGRVAVFCAVASLATAILFGIAPALRSARGDLMEGMRHAATSGRRVGRGRRGLVVAQIAVSCALLVAAGLLVRSLVAGRDLDIAIASNGVLAVHGDAGTLAETERTIRSFWRDLEAGIGALPGVDETSLTLFVPLAGRSDQMMAAPVGSPLEPRPLQYNLIGPGYLALLSIDLVAGRAFTDGDAEGATDVAIVNETLAAEWLDGDAVGRQLRLLDRSGVERLVRVVGVARDSTYRRLGEGPTSYLYLPERQWYRPDLVLLARSSPASGTSEAVAELGRALLPGLPLRIETMRRSMGFAFIVPRTLSITLATAGGAGLLLATIGLFGVVSQLTEQRLHELGVRAAVGARAQDLRRLVTRAALRLAVSGLSAGLLLAALGGRLIASFLYRVSSIDPLTYLVVGLVLLAATLAASFQPARRALRLDPVEVLRRD